MMNPKVSGRTANQRERAQRLNVTWKLCVLDPAQLPLVSLSPFFGRLGSEEAHFVMCA